MDLFYPFLSGFFLMYVFFTIHYLFYKNKSGVSAYPLPPGNTGLPFVGETLSFLSEGWKGHPENFVMDRMKKYLSKIFKSHLLGEKFVVFCGPNANKFLFSNETKLVEVWWPNHLKKIFPFSAQTSSKEEAIQMKKMLPNFLKPEALFRYIGIMDYEAKKHFTTYWENKSQVVVYPLTKQFTFRTACKLFISVEDPNHIAKFAEPFDKINSGIISLPIDLPGTPFNRAIKATKLIRKEFLKIIKQRKSDLADGIATSTTYQDLLSHMLLTCDENGKFMHENDIADKILGLLIAGHETTSSACSFIVYYLAQLPQVYDAVYQEQMDIANSKADGELLNWNDIQKMKYSWNVACEVLRMSPPLPGAYREAMSDFVYNGFSIPKGWKIYWTANSTHKNPEYFQEPFKFDPTRFEGSGPAPYTFVPFGGGPRMCPGKEYARIEILVFMHHIVKRFKWQKVIHDEKIVVDPMPVPAKGLPVRLYPHKPCMQI